jgi:hypothetical protein
MADVNVVLPWSICPIVPTFTCGFDLSNFSFPIVFLLKNYSSIDDTRASHGIQPGPRAIRIPVVLCYLQVKEDRNPENEQDILAREYKNRVYEFKKYGPILSTN